MKPPRRAAWFPAPYDLADAHAVRAVGDGVANGDQQKRAIRWIVTVASAINDLSFRPESDRETSFAEGRRFVGLEVVKLINMPADVLAKMARGTDERHDDNHND